MCGHYRLHPAKNQALAGEIANREHFSYYTSMKLREITQKDEWEASTDQLGIAEFLQSWQWGEFQGETGKQVVRLGVYEDKGNGSVVALLQGFAHELPLGIKYLYVPRIGIREEFIPSLREYAKQHGYAFVRIEPTKELEGKKVYNRQPQHTLVLNLQKEETELLADMHQKTRYNIRLAEKKGVEVREGNDIDVFWKLNEQTTGRDGFTSHDKTYYEHMLQLPMCHQLTAYYENEPVASNLYLSFNRVTTYLHGTSSNTYRNVMAPYLLQWTAIQFAKKHGAYTFDFWGIAPEIEKTHENARCSNGMCWDKTHRWDGITRFKVGFGGLRVSYGNAVDIVANTLQYTLYIVGRLVR